MTQQDLTDYASGGGDSSTARYAPDTCIGFDVTADFAHFRKVGHQQCQTQLPCPAADDRRRLASRDYGNAA